jgi:hypothetical protein
LLNPDVQLQRGKVLERARHGFISLFEAAALLLLGIGSAEAADTALLAETGGFLLGNARRCGVAVERVMRAGRIIRAIFSAASESASEVEVADARFVAIFLPSAYPEEDRNALVPACTAVVTQFEQLERHHQRAGFD